MAHEALDREVLAAIAGDVLRPTSVDEMVTAAKQMFEASTKPDTRTQQRRDLEKLEREQARLTEALAAGVEAPALIARLKATDTKRRELAAALEARQDRQVAETVPAVSSGSTPIRFERSEQRL